MFSILAALVLCAAPSAQNAEVPVASINSTLPTVIQPADSSALRSSVVSKIHEPKIEVPSSQKGIETSQMEEYVTQIITEGQKLEQKNQWKDALKLYTAAIRSNPGISRLQAYYSRAKILGDIQKRCENDGQINEILQWDAKHLDSFVREFWSIFNSCYVQNFTPAEVFYRETRCMDIALGNPLFCEKMLPKRSRTEIDSFRLELREFVRNSTIQTSEEMIQATYRLGNYFQHKFGQNASVLIMEGLFDFVVSLDPYSEVLLPEQYQGLITSVYGSFVGVGITILTTEEGTQIVGVLPDSPAANAKLFKGDQILAVNGNPIKGWGEEQVSAVLDGPENTVLRLKIQTGKESPREAVLIRRQVTISSIKHSVILPDSNGVGYICLNGFQSKLHDEMEAALEDLSRKGMRSLVIDLRGNTGGAVSAALEISDLFLNEGIILQVQKYTQKYVHKAHTNGKWNNLPLVVLIDGRSASASEIFAGAIQDQNRGQIIGTRSFGKGAIQTMYPISNSPFVMKITTSQFFSPSGKRYNYVGIQPDYEIRQVGKPFFEELEDVEQGPDRSRTATRTKDLVLEKAVEILSPSGWAQNTL